MTLSDGRELPARLLARNKHLDLAALAVDEIGLPAMTIGDSRHLQPGQILLAAGHPWGVLGAVTAGVFIGHESSRGQGGRGREWLVTDLRLRPGNSGGPMFHADGEMVGVSTMITGPDVAMAVPVHVAKGCLQEALRAEQAVA